MKGPGVHTVTAICPSCHQEVTCRVLVTASGHARTLDGPAQHQCPDEEAQK